MRLVRVIFILPILSLLISNCAKDLNNPKLKHVKPISRLHPQSLIKNNLISIRDDNDFAIEQYKNKEFKLRNSVEQQDYYKDYYLKGTSDIPIPDQVKLLDDNSSIFDTEAIRIINSKLILASKKKKDSIQQDYDLTLMQLGWKKTSNIDANEFVRGKESLIYHLTNVRQELHKGIDLDEDIKIYLMDISIFPY